MPKVIYFTGAPAAGKSSTSKELSARVPNLRVWEYGARLTAHCAARDASIVDQRQLRSRSAGIVTPEDVAAVDDQLLSFVTEWRGKSNVIIDSHPVTKESWGYRITPFSLGQFATLAPDEVWVLFASPEETRRRIKADDGGRPLITEEEARMHTMMQASVAATYGMSTRCPVYMFDTAVPREQLIEQLVGRLS